MFLVSGDGEKVGLSWPNHLNDWDFFLSMWILYVDFHVNDTYCIKGGLGRGLSLQNACLLSEHVDMGLDPRAHLKN